jgi:hypothetical protein
LIPACCAFLKLEKFTNMLYVGQDEAGTAVEEAKVGKIYGADVYESQLLSGTAPNATGAFWSRTHYTSTVALFRRRPALPWPITSVVTTIFDTRRSTIANVC